MKIVNCTKHSINLNDGTSFEPTKHFARVTSIHTMSQSIVCETKNTSQKHIIAPVFDITYDKIEGLPDPQFDTVYIVSTIALNAAKSIGRTDCMAPATGHQDAVRNDLGHILSVPGFVK